ncbi:YgaP-like transmembrane domain [Pseudomonas mangrovi]|uniref:Inner membrane protein YgaP-like transmembrane domain-containing protein n=1 Tax=Pseudomonas mangrovi TaxID=2161748 RepID=A0A2T5PDF1_9PSED|nr:YgaP-like transmembrane domain [Pseudomonas mangrovi]PTU75759.1 hypothetical protein DBO85_03555 [Pseudomonas mangrovi]
MKTLIDPSKTNVHGLERSASLGGGLALLGAGLSRGGLLGFIGAAVGGLLVARGATGQCELKRMLQEKQAQSPDKARYAHMPLDSESRSFDFDGQKRLPDSVPMGHESHLHTPLR